MKVAHFLLNCLIVFNVLDRSALSQPADVKRVIRNFDFEERRFGNQEDQPMHWSRVEGPGMPHYVTGRLTTDQARSGKYSFRLDLNGGSVAYRYDANRIRVLTGAHYRVEAHVRTTVLPHARARMTALLVDLDGHPIAGTFRQSELYAATNPNDDWHTLAIELSADDKRAAFIVLEVGLFQPTVYAPATLGSRQLNPQDVRGTAWFDDISISQVPKVSMWTDRPANVFRRGDPVRLVVGIDDRFTDDLSALILVRNAEGNIIFQRSGTAELGQAKVTSPGQKQWPVEIPEQPAGYYRITLELSSQGQSLGSQALAFVQLADAEQPARPDRRLGFIATSLPFEAWDDLPQVLPMLSAGRVKLALWSRSGDILDQDGGKFDYLLERLQEKGITPTACLLDLPPSLARKIGADVLKSTGGGTGGAGEWSANGVKTGPNTSTSALNNSATSSRWPALLRADPKDWQPALAGLIARHANHLDRWQMGEDGTDAFVQDPKMRQVYGLVYGQFRKLIQRPDLAMPWPAWYELDGGAPATVALSVPAANILPEQVPLYINEVTRESTPGARPTTKATGPAGSAGPTEVSVSLTWLDAARYGREEQLRDLARRVIYTMSAGARRIDLPLPIESRRDGDTIIREPTEHFIILRTLITTLGGATYLGKVPIADGIEAFLFDRAGQGVLAIWDRGAQAGVRDLAVNLGKQPTMIDLWGNVTALQKLRGQDGRVTLKVGRMPMFLTDVDGQLMQTRASVALDRPLIESSFQPHVRKLQFTNAYRTTMSGTVRLRAPAGWEIATPSFTFSLNPGEVFERDVSIQLPYNTLAGPKTIDAVFDVQADGQARFTVPITLTIGLSDIGMQTIAFRDGEDLIVQQTITNYGDKPINYNAFAVFPGQARQERLINGLGAGKTTIKRYKFNKIDVSTGGKVRAGVKETEGSRILNDEVAVQ